VGNTRRPQVRGGEKLKPGYASAGQGGAERGFCPKAKEGNKKVMQARSKEGGVGGGKKKGSKVSHPVHALSTK